MASFDITKHRLVPKHAIASDSEKKKVLETYKVTLNELPRILYSDPLVSQLHAKVGDLLKITRPSQTAGEALYYRVVVHG